MAKKAGRNEWLGAQLKDWDFRRRFELELCTEDFMARIKVEPCKVCLSAEHEEGRAEGKEEALDAENQ